jgi:hypothetical protein
MLRVLFWPHAVSDCPMTSVDWEGETSTRRVRVGAGHQHQSWYSYCDFGVIQSVSRRVWSPSLSYTRRAYRERKIHVEQRGLLDTRAVHLLHELRTSFTIFERKSASRGRVRNLYNVQSCNDSWDRDRLSLRAQYQLERGSMSGASRDHACLIVFLRGIIFHISLSYFID